MASLTSVGDNVTLSLSARGDQAAVALSGTYAMVVELQREQGSPGSGSWEKLKSWDTANATVAYTHTATRDQENLRVIVTTDTSGTCVATLTDALNLVVGEVNDAYGHPLIRVYQDGVKFYDTDGNVIFDSAPYVNVGDVTTYTVLANNTGKVHYIPDLTGDLTISLPTPASNLKYEFIYAGVAADEQDWTFDTGANANYFLGGLVHLDTDADDGGDEVVMIAGDGNSNSTCNVLTPEPGTRILLLCDGTHWILSGYVPSATVPAFDDQ